MKIKTYYTASDGTMFIPDSAGQVIFCHDNKEAASRAQIHEKAVKKRTHYNY